MDERDKVVAARRFRVSSREQECASSSLRIPHCIEDIAAKPCRLHECEYSIETSSPSTRPNIHIRAAPENAAPLPDPGYLTARAASYLALGEYRAAAAARALRMAAASGR